MSSETEVKARFEQLADAIRHKDLAGVIEIYAEDVDSFDVIDPLRYQGKGTGMERTKKWFETFDKNIAVEVLDLTVKASDTVAFTYSLNRYIEESSTGADKIDMWVRVTFGWEKRDGEWLIVHQHNSVPFNPETGKASLKIQP